MEKIMLKSKIHGARITSKNLNYTGSITIAEDLMIKADLIEYEQVHVVNITNGERFITYVIKGQSGSGEISLNGASARLGEVGDKLIILSYVNIDSIDAVSFEPKIVFTDKKNNVITKEEAAQLND